MPTPSDETPSLLSPPADALNHRAQHATCPPEEDRTPEHSAGSTDGRALPINALDDASSPPTQLPSPPTDTTDSVSTEIHNTTASLAKRMDIDEDGPIRDTPSPMSSATESKDSDQQAAVSQISTSPSTSIPYASLESPWVGQHRVGTMP